ncbi:MAG: hypothetical protein LBC92_03035 [Rickettsiales bacterium]|jgi:hypothetical protein|nr:hypothetical protein [Rickettsiales bacterium]
MNGEVIEYVKNLFCGRGALTIFSTPKQYASAFKMGMTSAPHFVIFCKTLKLYFTAP